MQTTLPAACPPAPVVPTKNGDQLARELAGLVEDIQRTRDWFNAQIEAQLTSLQQLKTAILRNSPDNRNSSISLFEAPPIAPTTILQPAPLSPALLSTGPFSSALLAPAPTDIGSCRGHEAIVLPPKHIAPIDQGMEQATLRELNNALSRAFSEISTRGAMPG